MNADGRSSSSIQSIERAVSLMRCFTEAYPELGVTELSQRLGLHKSTVSRILSTLQNLGFVSQNPVSGKYRLGVGLISLAGVALGQVDVRGAAYHHLDALVAQTQESASVSILDGTECVNVLNKPSPRPVRYDNWIGRRLPLHCTSSGKVLLAGLSNQEVEKILPRTLRCYTRYTISTLVDLETELEVVRARGYAIAAEEFESGYSAIAVPIHNHETRVVGALSISGPASRLTNETMLQLSAALKETVGRISAEMGYFRNSDGTVVGGGSG